jgi:flagellar hook-associated protein 1 FlgK
MSLFGIMQMSSNALNAASLGLQVTGNNLANANTPDYIRQRLVQTPQPGSPEGGLVLGLGVRVDGVQQVVDKFLDERMRSATSDVASSDAQSDAYSKLESIINALGDQNLGNSLTTFFGSLNDVQNQPQDIPVRSVAVQQGQALAGSIQRLDSQARSLHNDLDGQVVSTTSDINRLVQEIAKLNVQIATIEGGSTSASDAVGLRDKRASDLSQLAEITDIKTVEQPTGDVTVYSGGDYLISLGTFRQVKAVTSVQNGLTTSQIQIDGINSPLSAGGGRLGGLTAARDNIVGGFLGELDGLSKTLIGEFNKVYSSGQGLTGFSSVTSDSAVSAASAPLDEAGLPFTPVNGSFQVQVYDKNTGQKKTTDVRVDLNGLDTDTNLTTLAIQLDAIDGLSASVTPAGKLQITADSPQTTFAFADDTSGTLAALGINTFFTGTGSQDIGVSQTAKSDPGKLAFASGGLAEDTGNGQLLANLLNTPLASQNNTSLATLYDRLNSNVAQGSNSASAAADGFRNFQQTLESQHLAVSGVNIDEEAVRMLEYQRAFQASARVISAVNDMIGSLLNL